MPETRRKYDPEFKGALDPDAAWAIAFRDSLNSDALMQVALQGIDNAKKTSKPGRPQSAIRSS